MGEKILRTNMKMISVLLVFIIVLTSGCIEDKSSDNNQNKKNDENNDENNKYETADDSIEIINWTLEQSPIDINLSRKYGESIDINISAGVEINLKSNVYITFKGNFIAFGYSEKPIRFNGFYNSISIEGERNKTVLISHCHFKNISIAIINADLIISNCTFENSNLFVISSRGTIKHNFFNRTNLDRYSSAIGPMKGNISIMNNSINNYDFGISSMRMSNLFINMNTIKNCENGISVSRSNVYISKNNIMKSRVGIKVNDGNATIYKNIIKDNIYGLRLVVYDLNNGKNSYFTIINNLIIDNINNIIINEANVNIQFNNISTTYPNSSIIISSYYNHKGFEYIINNNIISFVSIHYNTSNSKKDLRYNFWDLGEIKIKYKYEDYYNWTHPVLNTKPEIDLS